MTPLTPVIEGLIESVPVISWSPGVFKVALKSPIPLLNVTETGSTEPNDETTSAVPLYVTAGLP